MKICFKDVPVLRDGKIEKGALFIADGAIVPPFEDVAPTTIPEGTIICPGFIDLQVNGGWGIDCSLGGQNLQELADHLAASGVTSFLATIVSQPLASYDSILASYPKDNPQLVGIHLEGPHINKILRGAHLAANIQAKVELPFWEKMVDKYAPLIVAVTLAPELDGALDLIEYLSEHAVIAAIGHSHGFGKTLEGAKHFGAKLYSHFFNCMKPFHHRVSGPTGFVLGERALPYTMICDGHHVDDATIKMAWNAHQDGFMIISDLSPAYGTSGNATLGGAPIEQAQGASFVKGSTTLSGGMLPLNLAVKKFKEITSVSLEDAVQCVTKKPAKILGLEGKKGELKVGADADFILLHPDTFEVDGCWLRGSLHGPSCNPALHAALGP